MNANKTRVVVVPCSGIGKPFGTVSREAAYELCEELRPESTRLVALKASLPGALFMMLTVYEDNDRLFQSLLAGASGYLLKRATPAEILEATPFSRATVASTAASEGDRHLMDIVSGFGLLAVGHSDRPTPASLGATQRASVLRFFNSAMMLRSSSTPEPPAKNRVPVHAAKISLKSAC